MEKKLNKDDPEWGIFRAVWQFYEKFAIPEENDQYWDDLIREAGELVKKYNNNALCERLVMGIMAALNDKAKNGQ